MGAHMARARNLKPGFFTNDSLAEVQPLGRILFSGLWCLADREGRLEDRPKKIKAEILPYDNCNADKLLDDLQERAFILRYTVDGVQYIQILNFTKHQNPHVREPASLIPAPVQHSAGTGRAPDETGTGPALSPSLDSPSRIPDSPTHSHVGPSPDREAVKTVFAHWQQTMQHPSAQLDAKREKAIKARIKDGYSASDLCRAVDGCRNSPHHMGENDRSTVYDDIELICRDGPHVDKFIKLAEKNPALLGLSAAGRKTATSAEIWLKQQQEKREVANGQH